MYSLPEEFLLLCILPGKSGFVELRPESEACGIVGLALMDLALRGRVDSDKGAIWLVSGEETGDAALDEVIGALAPTGHRHEPAAAVEACFSRAAPVRAAALARLGEAGLTLDKGGLLSRRTTSAKAGEASFEARRRLLKVLLSEDLPDARDLCLLSVLQPLGLLPHIVPPEDRDRAEARLAAISRLDLVAVEVQGHVNRLRESLSRALLSRGIMFL